MVHEKAWKQAGVMASFMAPRYPADQEREAGAGANQCQGRGGIHRGVSESFQRS